MGKAKLKWGDEGPTPNDFGWVGLNFIGMLVVKVLAFLVMRIAFQYFRKKFESWKQRGEKKKPAVNPSYFDFDTGEDVDDQDQAASESSPSRNEGAENFARTIKSEDIHNDLRKWAETYKNMSKSKTVKVEESSLAAGKRLLEKIRERQQAEQAKQKEA